MDSFIENYPQMLYHFVLGHLCGVQNKNTYDQQTVHWQVTYLTTRYNMVTQNYSGIGMFCHRVETMKNLVMLK